MSSGASVMPVLEERPGGFNYGYRMNCECDRTSFISGPDYHARSTVDALMPCDHCHRIIHFGPTVAALRDPDDVAVDSTRIDRLAWYHTSTSPDWPSAAYAAEQRTKLLATAHRFPGIADRVIERQVSQALHVGTYESAIANMLRRMRNQNDAASQFYLHRVALTVDPHRINTGYRDENHEPAAQLTTTDLHDAGLAAVRYLNVHEDVGSLSLAVLPQTIAWVQTISLPVARLLPAHDASLVGLLDEVQGRFDHVRGRTPDTSAIDPIQLRMMRFGAGVDPDGIAAMIVQLERERLGLWSSLDATLAERYLADISPVVIDDFDGAMSAWRRDQEATAHEFADFFAASALALTRPNAVTEFLATQEPRVTRGPRSSAQCGVDEPGDSPTVALLTSGPGTSTTR